MAAVSTIEKASKTKQGGKEVTTVEVITPKIAAEWLSPEINSHNRTLVTKKVTQYARDMEEGRWRYNNDAICFDIDGVLLNGQHRLHASVMSGKSFRAVIIRGMPRDTQSVMDQHVIRTMGQILQLDGHQRTNRLGATLRALILMEHAGESYNGYRPTNGEMLDLLVKHPKLEDSVAMVDKASRGISASQLAAIHYIGKHLLKEGKKADAFVQVFLKGVPAYPNDPAHALRENALRHVDRKTRKTGAVAFYSLIRAWNAFRDDQQFAKWSAPKSDLIPIKGLRPGMI